MKEIETTDIVEIDSSLLAEIGGGGKPEDFTEPSHFWAV